MDFLFGDCRWDSTESKPFKNFYENDTKGYLGKLSQENLNVSSSFRSLEILGQQSYYFLLKTNKMLKLDKTHCEIVA